MADRAVDHKVIIWSDGRICHGLESRVLELPRPFWSSSSEAELSCFSRGHGACSCVCMQGRRAGLQPFSPNVKASPSSRRGTPLPCTQWAKHLDTGSHHPRLRGVRRLLRRSLPGWRGWSRSQERVQLQVDRHADSSKRTQGFGRDTRRPLFSFIGEGRRREGLRT